jgi:hypothetical protein
VDVHDPVAGVEALQVGAGDSNFARGRRVGKVRPVANSRVLRTRKCRQTRCRLRKSGSGRTDWRCLIDESTAVFQVPAYVGSRVLVKRANLIRYSR